MPPCLRPAFRRLRTSLGGEAEQAAFATAVGHPDVRSDAGVQVLARPRAVPSTVDAAPAREEVVAEASGR